MNQRNPFMMRSQFVQESSDQVRQPVQQIEVAMKPSCQPQGSSRENQLLADLAFERKRYAEVELALLNQKVNAVHLLIQNFEMKIMQLRRDATTYTNEIADKKREITALSKDYEDRKKIITESV